MKCAVFLENIIIIAIALTLEEWSYSYKANLRWLNLVHLYKEMVLRICEYFKCNSHSGRVELALQSQPALAKFSPSNSYNSPCRWALLM